jgi:hypothetical protein
MASPTFRSNVFSRSTKNRLALAETESAPEAFFDVFQAGVQDLFHAVHLATKDFFDIIHVPIHIVDSAVGVGKTNVLCPREIREPLTEIVQALIIDQYADEHG